MILLSGIANPGGTGLCVWVDDPVLAFARPDTGRED